MSPRLPLLVFSDLDGTLLDHETYEWAPAGAALVQLDRIGAGVVLASSKTAAEIAPLRADMGLARWPAIVENGGGLLPPEGTDPDDAAPTYGRLRAILATLPKGFKGFGDMTANQIADITGLSPDAAQLARTRQFSEPGLWHGDEAALDAFLDAARAAGLTAQRGGRFLTLSFGGTKADRMTQIIAQYAPAHVAALGDAPNDIAMLNRADTGVIVANTASPGIPPQPGDDTGQIRRTVRPGPQGWAEAILALIQDLKITKDQNAHG